MIQELIDRAARRHQVPGAAIAVGHRGSLVDAATGTGITPETLFPIWSVSKTWTAFLVMQLVDEGLVELDAPVRRYLPEFGTAVTVRQLLSNTAGFDGDVWDDTGLEDDALERYVALLHDRSRQLFEPGVLYSYNNAGFAVAGLIVARLRGGTWEDAVRDRIVQPMGARLVSSEPHGLPRALGPAGTTIRAAPRELVAFGRMLLSDGAVEVMATPHATVPDRTGTRYGLGLYLYDWNGVPAFGHDGDAAGQSMRWRVLPDHDLVLAVSATGGRVTAFFDEVIGTVATQLAGVEVPAPPVPPPAPSSVELSQFAGRYEHPLYVFDVTVAGDGLDVTARPNNPGAPIGDATETARYVHLDGDLFISAEPHDGRHLTFAFLDGGRYLHDGRAARRR